MKEIVVKDLVIQCPDYGPPMRAFYLLKTIQCLKIFNGESAVLNIEHAAPKKYGYKKKECMNDNISERDSV